MGTTEVLGFSFAQGIALLIITILLGWFTTEKGLSFTKWMWVILPIISYGVALGLLSASNFAACGKINITLVATASFFTLAAVIVFMCVSFLGFFRNFIIPILPYEYQASFGAVVATAFYMFWAGLYGGAFGMGFTQSCV
jgi:hypothetical protein